MANKYVNKLIVGTEVKLDLSGDTIVASDLKKGVTAHDKSGASITGTNEFDVNSQDADAAVAEVLAGKTFYARGSKLTGTMPDNGAKTLDIAEKDAIEIYVDGESIILKKYEPTCIFCGDGRNVENYRGKNICANCMKELRSGK